MAQVHKKEFYPDVAGRDEVDDIAKRLTDHKKAKNVYNVSPSISPDGGQIAYLTNNLSYFDIDLIDAVTGKKIKKLIKGSRSLDFEELTANQTKDRTILKLLNYIPAKTAKIKLKVNPPKVFVKSNEKEFGKVKPPSISSTVKQVLNSRGLKVVKAKKEADLILLINSDTRILGSNRGTYQVELTGTVEVVKISDGEVVFSEVIPSTKGLQLSRVKASVDAYSKAAVYVKRRLIPKLTDQYFAF